jgi:hypothetical protein
VNFDERLVDEVVSATGWPATAVDGAGVLGVVDGVLAVASGFLGGGTKRTSGNGRSVVTQPVLQTATATNERVKTDRMRAASSTSDAGGPPAPAGVIPRNP